MAFGFDSGKAFDLDSTSFPNPYLTHFVLVSIECTRPFLRQICRKGHAVNSELW
ncbi:hypothetical protein ACSS6W_010206 [Trichoderma asperelloides]